MRTARAIGVAYLVLWPVCASADLPHPPACVQLAQLILNDQNVNNQQGRMLNDRKKNDRKVLAATSVIQPATATDAAYCLVNLTQAPTINVAVGLPLSAADGGTGGVQGAWKGKVDNLGGGGYGGSIGAVTPATDIGYVGSMTDTGHSPAWCNAINPATGQPNSQPNCGLSGGGFILDPENDLYWWQVRFYLRDGILAQTLWALELTKIYYGREAERNYWTGCSQGGRQGFYLAETFPWLFDGYLNGAPAININRFIEGEEWPTTIAYTLPGHVLSTAKSAAAQAAAIAACGADYGAGLGIIGEPRRCEFDAKSLICTGKPSDPPTCLTPQEAEVIDSIWEGPLDKHGANLWGGIPKGASFNTLLPGGTGPTGIVQTWPQNWVHQDPNFNVFLITPSNFEADFETSYYKYENFAQDWGTDNTNLDGVRKRGAKIIHYHSSADPLTVTYTSYNYVTRVFDRYGVPETQKFFRTFYYPGNGHCGGGTGPQINTTDLFNALQNWVENGVAPDYIVASGTVNGSTPITRPICKYPDEAEYDGGSIYDASNFHCVVHNNEPADLAAASRSNHDHPETDPKLRFKFGNDHDHDD